LTKFSKRSESLLLLVFLVVLTVGKACSNETYGPYHVIGYNYTERNVALFNIDGFGAGNSNAHRSGGGGGIVCCFTIPEKAKTLHFKVALGLTQEQYDKDLPNDTFETDIPVPELQDKHRGYIEVHFLPERKIEAKWVDFPTTPHIPNATE